MSPACYSPTIHHCKTCGLHTLREHKEPGDCIAALRRRLDDDSPVFDLSTRRLRFITHPDAEPGEYAIVAGFGDGATLFTGAVHEIALTIDESTRQKLITLLQGEPEQTS